MNFAKSKGADIAAKWGPAFTKGVLEDDFEAFGAMFVEGQPVVVVVQTGDGEELETSIGDDPETATLTWAEFKELTKKDMEAQNYARSEAQCLGVLGDRMIIEIGRFNTSGEVYMVSYAILTLNEEGKVSVFESFSEPMEDSHLLAAAQEKQAEERSRLCNNRRARLQKSHGLGTTIDAAITNNSGTDQYVLKSKNSL